MKTEELKRCPFCGAWPKITFSSDSAIVWCMKCGGRVMSTEIKDGMNPEDRANLEWNRRAPEPGTSVIRWTLYDGRPKTLPEPMKSVLMIRPFCIGMTIRFLTAGNPTWKDAGGYQDDVDAKSGDLWAYFPKPPEGMEWP